MKIKSLTLKHEAFVLNLMKGMTAADSARAAGYGKKNANVRIVAWELLQRSDIQARLKELLGIATSEGVLTAIERKVILSNMIRNNDRPLEAIVLLNKMDEASRPRKTPLPTTATVVVRG